MKKLEVSEEFIKEAHKAACSELKGKIEKEFHELFEVKLGVGSWYKNLTHEGSFMFYDGTILDCGNYGSYGVDYLGKWHNEGGCGMNDNYVLATKEEIETMLWKEAEERGIGKDTKIEECLYWTNDEMGIVNTDSFNPIYLFDEDQLWNKNACVYCSGQWATPLNENEEIQDKINSL